MSDYHSRDRNAEVTVSQIRLAQDGVAFEGRSGTKVYQFLIESGTLEQLPSVADADSDMLRKFQRHQSRIRGVAARLIGAGVTGEPIVLRSALFTPGP